MNGLIERLMGVNVLTDQVIAMDLLMSAKTGIKLYAVAATEAVTPEVKATLVKHLDEAIATHAALTEYMMAHGYYHPHDPVEQIALDRKNAATALKI
ncbi:MAG: spore coat protein [Mycobacterium leprae]